MDLLTAVALLLLSAAPGKPLALEVPTTARAWTIETSAMSGGAVLKAKDRIDVLAVVTDPETKRSAGVLLLQDITVLANAAPERGEARQLSLLVLPEEAVLLATARAHGHLTAILRNPEDVVVLERRVSVSVSTVVAGGELPPKKPSPVSASSSPPN